MESHLQSEHYHAWLLVDVLYKSVYCYRICGLKIASDFILQAAGPVRVDVFGACDLVIQEGHIDDDFFNTELPCVEDSAFFLLHRIDSYLLHVVNQCCIEVKNGKEIIYRLKAGCNLLVLEEIILCVCLNLALIQRKRFMLHGSCICAGDKAVIISGDKGAGKSTVTDEILQRGAAFMADDFVALTDESGVIYAHPAYPQRKLKPDVVKKRGYDTEKLLLLQCGKYALRFTENFCREKKPLGALVVLNISQEAKKCEIQEIYGSEKLKYVVNNLFAYDIHRRKGLKREQFLACLHIADKIPVYSLTRPAGDVDPGEMAGLLGIYL